LAGALLLDLRHPLDGLQSLLPGLAAVFDGHVAALLELEAGIDGQLLAGGLAVRLRPADLAGVLLPLEGLVALAPTEFEDLHRNGSEPK